MMEPRRQALIGAVAAIAIVGLFFFFVLSPKLNQITETRDELEVAQDRAASLRAQIENLEEIRRRAPETRARLSRLRDLLPEDPELPAFIRLLQEAAVREGVELQSLAPSPPAPAPEGEGIQLITVNTVVQASFHRLENFLARLENLDRVVEVTSISLSPVDDPLSDRVALSGTLTVRMYVVEDEARVGGSSPTVVSTQRPEGT
jgi:Tfp pilus assembly protein PilO